VKLWLVAIAAIAIAACVPRDREVRLARARGEGRALEERLEVLQARLIADQARVRYWEEMRGRYQLASAISCSNLDAHAVAMARRELPEDLRPTRAPRSLARRVRLAALHTAGR